LTHKERKDVIRYSEAFKLRLVEEAASGKYRSLDEAGRRNGICGCVTLGRRIKQYGRADALPKRIKAETMNERDELHEARKRIREREAELAVIDEAVSRYNTRRPRLSLGYETPETMRRRAT
jgi:transposase-like protein